MTTTNIKKAQYRYLQPNGPGHFIAQVLDCPFCEGTHRHGMSNDELGSPLLRLSHCTDKKIYEGRRFLRLEKRGGTYEAEYIGHLPHHTGLTNKEDEILEVLRVYARPLAPTKIGLILGHSYGRASSAVTHNLKKLVRLGLVKRTLSGKRAVYERA